MAFNCDEQNIKMCESFVTINKIPVKVFTYGKSISEDFQSNELNDIIIFIPGTIGITTFYATFLETIHKETGYPIWSIGHTGHDVYQNGLKCDLPSIENNETLYGLQGQIDHKVCIKTCKNFSSSVSCEMKIHVFTRFKEYQRCVKIKNIPMENINYVQVKVAFMEKYVPKNARIHFIGHSIGSYIILKLLEVPSINQRVENCYYLFPAIEDMKQTPNGFIFKFLKYIIGLILFLCWVFSFFPTFIQSFLIYIYLCAHHHADKNLVPTIRSFMDPNVLDKIFFMLFDEMEILKDRNTDVIKANKNKMKFYYGKSDGWVPVRYYKNLKEDVPSINAELCSKNFRHYFVLHDSAKVGKMVASWIGKK